MLNNDMILIPRETLLDLIRDSNTLTALEIGGVDNWDWYGYSIREYVNEWKRNNSYRLTGTDSENIDIETMSKFELEEYRTLSDLMSEVTDFVDNTLG